MQTILTLYRVCANYTGWYIKKHIFFLSLIYTGYSKQSHVRIKTNMILVYQGIRLLNKNWNCSINVHMVKCTGWSKLRIFQQKKVTNSVIKSAQLTL